jgi:hypothetical protein
MVRKHDIRDYLGLLAYPIMANFRPSQTYMNFGGFILLMVGYSFILSWVRKISGDRPFSGLYVHGLFNAFIPLMPTLIMQKNVSQPRFWIWITLTLLIGIIITILLDKRFVRNDSNVVSLILTHWT